MKALRMVLAAVQAMAAQREENDRFWTWTIHTDGDPYLTRTLFPRAFGHRLLLHHIHRGDGDRHLHNHPWDTARFLILSGGYVEERLVAGKTTKRWLGPGDTNTLDADVYHRISFLERDTWTVGLVGKRVQEWGFLVPTPIEWAGASPTNVHVPHNMYRDHCRRYGIECKA